MLVVDVDGGRTTLGASLERLGDGARVVSADQAMKTAGRPERFAAVVVGPGVAASSARPLRTLRALAQAGPLVVVLRPADAMLAACLVAHGVLVVREGDSGLRELVSYLVSRAGRLSLEWR